MIPPIVARDPPRLQRNAPVASATWRNCASRGAFSSSSPPSGVAVTTRRMSSSDTSGARAAPGSVANAASDRSSAAWTRHHRQVAPPGGDDVHQRARPGSGVRAGWTSVRAGAGGGVSDERHSQGSAVSQSAMRSSSVGDTLDALPAVAKMRNSRLNAPFVSDERRYETCRKHVIKLYINDDISGAVCMKHQ